MTRIVNMFTTDTVFDDSIARSFVCNKRFVIFDMYHPCSSYTTHNLHIIYILLIKENTRHSNLKPKLFLFSPQCSLLVYSYAVREKNNSS